MEEEENGVCWWKTPPGSLDTNPIENVWHELKEFMRREVKPHNISELVDVFGKIWTKPNARSISATYRRFCQK